MNNDNCQGHHDEVNATQFTSNGNLLASASEDKTIKLWQLDGTLIILCPVASVLSKG